MTRDLGLGSGASGAIRPSQPWNSEASAPGYQDWVSYQNHIDYAAGVFEYLVHPSTLRLFKLASGVQGTSPQAFYSFGGPLFWREIGDVRLYHSSVFVDMVLLPTDSKRTNIRSNRYSYRILKHKNDIIGGSWVKGRAGAR